MWVIFPSLCSRVAAVIGPLLTPALGESRFSLGQWAARRGSLNRSLCSSACVMPPAQRASLLTEQCVLALRGSPAS